MECLTRDALDWSLTHIERFGDTDFFPVPFEFAAIRHSWDRVRAELMAIDLEKYRPHAPRRLAVPKPTGGFRIVTQLDPKDSLVYTAMVYEASSHVEISRMPADRQIACSYRILPKADGALFAEHSGWPEFHTRSRQLSESGRFEFVLVADITDFFTTKPLSIASRTRSNSPDFRQCVQRRLKHFFQRLLQSTRGGYPLAQPLQSCLLKHA